MRKIQLFILFSIISSLLLACADSKDGKSELENNVTLAPEENITSLPEANVTLAPEENANKGDSQATPVFTDRTALEFVNDMGIGWNLGNSLDPVDCTWLSGDNLDYEKAWGNVKTTQRLIQYIKSEGFDTIRIPVTWTNHTGEAPDYVINENWLNRVQEIVDWCMEEDMYVIINMHHDGGWIETASTDYETMITKYLAIWSQIADRFGDYSENLIFESMNEVGFDDLGTKKGSELLNQINAEFVKIIRSSGKHNSERFLLLAGYWTDIDRTCGNITNQDDERAIISVHYYSPAQFAIAEPGTSWGFQETWGTEQDYTYLGQQMDKLKASYIDQGIPVIIGEFGCRVEDKEEQSRINYLSSIVEYARNYGICPILWDNGEEIKRILLQWRTEGLADAIRSAK